jgi:hypothetical protein
VRGERETDRETGRTAALTRRLPLLWALALTCLLLGPALGPGYVLTYDMVWVPHLDLRASGMGLGSALPRAVPSDAVLAVLDNAVPAVLLQKAVLLLPTISAAVGMCRLVGPTLTARLVATTLTVWNPFVVERWGIGHWTVLIGYGVLPWLVVAGRRARVTGRLPAWAWVLAPLGSLSATAGVVTAVTLLVMGWPGGRSPHSGLPARLLACAVAANAPWLVAGALHAGAATGTGASVFALHGEGSLPAPLAALTMGGIWNSEVVPGSRQTFLAWVTLVLLLGLAAAGIRRWRRWHRGESVRLLVLWSVGFGVAVITWALPGVLDRVAEIVPGGGLLRDGTRVLAWCLPVYAGLPAAGAARLADLAAREGAGARRLVAAACLGLPVLLLYDAGWGISGDLRAVHYPHSWVVVSDRGYPPGVDRGDGDVLVLPLSAYRAPAWNHGRTVLDPLGRYLKPDTVVDDTLIVSGRVVPGDDPRLARIKAALALNDPVARARDLRADGIRDVAVQTAPTSADPSVPDLDANVVVTTPDLVLLRLPGPVPTTDPATLDRLAIGGAWLVFLLGPLRAGLRAARVLATVVRRGRRRGGRRPAPSSV